MFEKRINNLRTKLKEADIDTAVITDDDSVYYYTGYCDYLHMDFWRPTILIVPKDDKSLLITPTVDMALADDSTKIDVIKAQLCVQWHSLLTMLFTCFLNLSLSKISLKLSFATLPTAGSISHDDTSPFPHTTKWL